MSQTLALLYHEVVDDFSESGFQNKDNLAYMHKTEVFARHISLFKSKLEANKNSSIGYQLTFDDGGISNLKSAQILEENGLRGLYFITTNKIGTPGFLTGNDILKLHENGHIIGSHSHTHPMIFRSLTYSKMLEEWRNSKEILKTILGKEVEYCSIPGGDSDENTYKSASEAGFKFIYDSEPIIETRELENSKIYGRLSVKAQTSDVELQNMLELKNLKALQRNRAFKKTIKKIIFPLHQYLQNKKNES